MTKADLLLSSHHVFTGLQDEPIPAAIAVTNNIITAIGTKEELQDCIGENTKVYDMEDELILPGFHDFHMHIMMGSIMEKESVSLFNTKSAAEVAEMVAGFAEKRPGDDWIIGIGWDHTSWDQKELPHRRVLDSYIADRPVLLFNAEVHYAWINSKAMEVIQLTEENPNPEYGEIGKDEYGQVTGILFEHAMGYATDYAYQMSKEERVQLLQGFLNETAKFGITSVNDLYGAKIAPNQLEDIELFSEFEQDGRLTTRIHFSPELRNDLKEAQQLHAKYHSPCLSLSGLKQFIDGVVTGHTAFLLEPYLDSSETRGGTTQSPEKIKAIVKQADKQGFQIRFHAIGNAAVRLALDAFEEARGENGSRDSRHVIEHVEVLHPDDIYRFKELGVIASFQPYHIGLMESQAYTSRISEQQQPLYYPIKTVSDTGAKIAFGTDFPVVSLNPMNGIYHAITREDLSRNPWEKGEGISLAQALKNYTSVPAYGSFREKELGTLEVGKLADIVVLNKNLFAIPTKEILQTEVKLTIMDGKVIFENQSVPTV
ncbi:amidohydrolase [Cytobacillus sp. Hz8]|uniref:amidohydrolase n=1 Tax=Cytobacillus sp. Hz8 TaxID=3347168 RepID=UPI0035DADC7D